MTTALNRRPKVRKNRMERLEIRVSHEQKERFLKAAARQGRTLTQFTVINLEEAARKAIEEHRIFKLSEKDSDAFVNVLLAPPAPNERLKQAVQRFKSSAID